MKKINIGKKAIVIFVALFVIGCVLGVIVGKKIREEKEDASEIGNQDQQVSQSLEMKDGEIVDYDKEGSLTLANYIGLKGTVTPEEEDIYRFILDRIETEKITVLGEERVRKGDWVMMDYTGEINGQIDENLEEEGIVIQVGADNLFNADFQRKLTGLSVGEEYKFDVNFPKDYFDVDVAGQNVTFTVTISEKYNEAFVEKLSKGKYKTAKQYYEYAREQVRKDNIEGLGDVLWDEYLEKCEVKKYPKGSKKQAYADLKKQYNGVGELSGLSYEEIIGDLGMTDQDVKDLARDEVKGRMVAKTIASKENLKLTEDQYRKYLEDEVSVEEADEMTLAALEEDYRTNTGMYPRDDMLIKLVKEFIGKKAKQE